MGSLAWSFLMLLLVIALIPVSLWLVKRLQQLQAPGQARAMELLAQLALGPRERVVAVRVGQRVLVLGVSAQQVSMLVELQEGLETGADTPAAKPDFGATLRSFAGRTGAPR